MRIVERLVGIWNAPIGVELAGQRVKDLEGQVKVLQGDLEDTTSECDSLKESIGELEGELKDIPSARDFESLGGQVEEFERELSKLDDRVEGLEGMDEKIDRMDRERLAHLKRIIELERRVQLVIDALTELAGPIEEVKVGKEA